MSRIYYGILHSDNPKLMDKPVDLKVGETVRCKLKSVTPLNYDPTDVERKWYKEQIIPNVIKVDK